MPPKRTYAFSSSLSGMYRDGVEDCTESHKRRRKTKIEEKGLNKNKYCVCMSTIISIRVHDLHIPVIG